MLTISIRESHRHNGDGAFHRQKDSKPIRSDKGTITIGEMINYDSHHDGHGDGDVTCKQTFNFPGSCLCSSLWTARRCALRPVRPIG